MGRKYPTIATAVTAMIAQACGLVTANDPAPADTPSVAGRAGSGGAAGGGGGSLTPSGTGGGLDIDVDTPCRVDPPLRDQVVAEVGSQRTFYSWTTQEQVDELRAGTELFSRSERAGKGRGQLFVSLAEMAASPAMTPDTALAEVLVNDVFAKARYAWTNPWATLMGFPGESYGDQLLKVELKPEAWIARFELGRLSVVDVNNQEVPLETALASPERIGAIFHLAPGSDTQHYCGTFSQGAVGYREFALGNLSMVERWSLATPQINERLEKDIAALRAFADQLACVVTSVEWSAAVMCEWGSGYFPGGALSDYDFSVSLPSELYRPTPENLEALIAALEATLPMGEPLIVTPGE